MPPLRPLFRLGIPSRCNTAWRTTARGIRIQNNNHTHHTLATLNAFFPSHQRNCCVPPRTGINIPRFFSTDSEDNKEKTTNEPFDSDDSTTTKGETDNNAPPPPQQRRRRRRSGKPSYDIPLNPEEYDDWDESTSKATTTTPTRKNKQNPIDAAPTPGSETSMSFQAETRQLLDIVTNSLYTEKEIFLRELVSNASDALEKLRHLQSTGQAVLGSNLNKETDDLYQDHKDTEEIPEDMPLEISIDTNLERGIITITDTGIGLTKEEMIDNLGTIARSGSKSFLQYLKKSGEEGHAYDASRGIIGKFGVGFYSAFMVGNKVEVRSRSALESNKHLKPAIWTSDGSGSFDIADLEEDSMERGTSIVIHLKDEYLEYADRDRLEGILKKYSNFVNFPIWLDNDIVNVMEAVWAKDPKEVDKDTYTAFYRFIANAFDEPYQILHFRADAPIDVKALFFIPSFHSEKYGMERMKPGVSLYSRKVLIEAKSPDILPDWMRFVKGVVDSEDLPLAVSREKAQDSALIAKLRRVLTRKFISHLTKLCRKNVDSYIAEFYKEYSFFLKEGICQDFEFQGPLAKLLYYESSKGLRGDVINLDEYIARCKPEQKEIYFLHTPDRDTAVQSPYLEAFEKAGVEVFFVYTAIDEFVMSNLQTFEGRKLVNVDKSDIKLPESKDNEEDSTSKNVLSEFEIHDFCSWFRVTLGERVKECRPTTRLGNSPAIVTDVEGGAVRRMMKLVDTTEGGRKDIPLQKQRVEVNMNHPIILGLNAIREKEPTLALVLAEQIFDNCLIAAGLLDDGRSMLPRLNDILSIVVKDAQSAISKGDQDETSSPASAIHDIGATATVMEKKDPEPVGNDGVDVSDEELVDYQEDNGDVVDDNVDDVTSASMKERAKDFTINSKASEKV